MNRKSHGELRKLICKLSDGLLTAEDAFRLNQLLKDDPIAQESYLDHVMIHGLLEREFNVADAGSPSTDQDGKSSVKFGRVDLSPQALGCNDLPAGSLSSISRSIQNAVPLIRRRFPLWVLALSLLLIAGLATRWFLPLPRPGETSPQPLALSDAGFEAGLRLPVEVGATAVDRWYGDTVESLEHYNGVIPVEGRRMLRFVESSAEPGSACEVYQFVDLRSVADIVEGDAFVEASAFFNSLHDELDETDYTFGLTIFAFSEDPSDESMLWPIRWQQPLSFSGRQLPADAVPQSWQQVDTRLMLPSGTQFLVVQLSVIRSNPDVDGHFPGQFADNVTLNLASTP